MAPVGRSRDGSVRGRHRDPRNGRFVATDFADGGPYSNGPIAIEDGDHGVDMRITASLGLTHAIQLHAAAIDLVNRGEPVTVNCEAAGHLHMSAVQILLLLKIELGGIGKDVEFVGVQPQVLGCLRAAGLEAALRH